MLYLNIFYGVLFFLYGVIIGSFLNVCILRIPLNETIVTTPSHCMSCGHKLAWYDLFPLFSYLFLGGKCRYCKAKISWQYPLVEFLNGVLYLLTFLVLGVGNSITQTVYTFIVCIFLSTMLVLSGIDIMHQIVPDKINLFIFVLGVITTAIDYQHWPTHVIGFFAVSVPLFILLLFGGMGGGDVKLYAAAGLLIGWKLALLSIILASVFGAIASVIMLITGKAKDGGKTRIPFVPFIALSMLVVIFWGSDIINWYITKFFPAV